MTRSIDHSARIEVLSSSLAVREILESAMAHLAEWGLATHQTGPVHIVMAEVLNNVVEHAYGYADGWPIAMDMQMAEGRLVCTVTDQGRAFPDGQPPAGELVSLDCALEDLPEGGFGWFMIRDQTESLFYERVGGSNCMTLRFSIA